MIVCQVEKGKVTHIFRKESVCVVKRDDRGTFCKIKKERQKRKNKKKNGEVRKTNKGYKKVDLSFFSSC